MRRQIALRHTARMSADTFRLSQERALRHVEALSSEKPLDSQSRAAMASTTRNTSTSNVNVLLLRLSASCSSTICALTGTSSSIMACGCARTATPGRRPSGRPTAGGASSTCPLSATSCYNALLSATSDRAPMP